MGLIFRAVSAECFAGLDEGMPDATFKTVPLSKLKESKDNPRQQFADLSELADSIRSQGILEPILVREVDGELEIIAGHRRARAAKLAGLKQVEVVVREMDRAEALAAAITENAARESLNPMELARGYQNLIEMGVSQENVAKRMGVGRASVYAYTALLRLPTPIQTAISSGKLPADAGRAIAGVDGERLQLGAFHEAMKLTKPGERGPSTRAVLRLVQQKFSGKAKKGLNKAQREAKEHGAEVALRRRVLPLLLDAVAERLERKAQMPEEDMRLMAIAHAETGPDVIREVFQRRGLRPDRLSKVGATQLRSLAAVLAYAPAVALVDGEYPPFARTLAKVHGLSLAELEKSVAQVEAAEKLFKKS